MKNNNNNDDDDDNKSISLIENATNANGFVDDWESNTRIHLNEKVKCDQNQLAKMNLVVEQYQLLWM